MPSAPRLIFFHLATAEQGEHFFSERFSEAPSIADPEQHFYRAFGQKKGSIWQLFGPKVWAAGFRAMRRGHGVGKPTGDPLVMSGLHLVRGREILDQLPFSHAGDHSVVDGMISKAAELGRNPAAPQVG